MNKRVLKVGETLPLKSDKETIKSGKVITTYDKLRRYKKEGYKEEDVGKS